MSAAAEFISRTTDAEANFRLHFAVAPLAFALLDAGGNITQSNAAWGHIFSNADRAKSLRFIDLLDPELEPQGPRLMRDFLDGRRNSFQIETRSPTCTLTTIRWTVWRLSGVNQSDFGIVSAETFEKGTESEHRLRQLTRLESIGRLTAGVVHDFNNVLTGLLLYCDLLLANLQDQHSRKYAEQIRSAGVQAAGVVRQLLNIAKADTRQPRSLSLNEVIEAVRELFSRVVGENIELILRLDPKLGFVWLDYTQAQQILLNLVLNARDAMPAGGRIVIETRNCDIEILHESGVRMPCVALTVSDDGIGMDAFTRAHLFEAFFTTKGSKGTGLGLAGVYDTVTTNGGLIHVASSPGAGTRVNILLPLAAESLETSMPTQGSTAEGNQGLIPTNQEV